MAIGRRCVSARYLEGCVLISRALELREELRVLRLADHRECTGNGATIDMRTRRQGRRERATALHALLPLLDSAEQSAILCGWKVAAECHPCCLRLLAHLLDQQYR